jgi:hypothetical protein
VIIGHYLNLEFEIGKMTPRKEPATEFDPNIQQQVQRSAKKATRRATVLTPTFTDNLERYERTA